MSTRAVAFAAILAAALCAEPPFSAATPAAGEPAPAGRAAPSVARRYEPDAARSLIAAAARGDAAALEKLLRAGADPDRSDASGWTALHESAERGELASARVLIRNGASLDLRSRARGTALDVAESSRRAELARLLREAGARGSGKSIGDLVCVRPWSGEGYCARVLDRDATRFELRVVERVGCALGCAAEACSEGRPVGPGGIGPGDRLWVAASCLTDTGRR